MEASTNVATSSPCPPVALVTGPTAGIGLSFADQLARRGDDLVLVARDAAGSRRSQPSCARRTAWRWRSSRRTWAIVTELATVEARVADRARPVDLLVNNAGFGLKGRSSTTPSSRSRTLLDVLVTAVLRLSHAALGPMVGAAAAARSSTSPASPATCPAAPTAPPRPT